MKAWDRFKKPVFIGLPLLILSVILIGFIYNRTSTNQYCGTNCHIMNPYYASFLHNFHREDMRVNCRDCHIPKDNIAEALVYKAYSGAIDVYKNTFNQPVVIIAKPWSRRIIQRNCIRCHQTAVEHINTVGGKQCFECHRGIPHGQGYDSFSTQNIYIPIRQ